MAAANTRSTIAPLLTPTSSVSSISSTITNRSESAPNPTPDASPSATPAAPSTTAKTRDIWHFFNKRSGDQDVVCRLCEATYDRHIASGDPPLDHTWKYRPSTSNTNLRRHLYKHHTSQYVQACREHGFEVAIPELVALAASVMPQPKYTTAGFHKALLDWIIADDQSINVVESPEFRALLTFLRDDVRNGDLPHRTKLTRMVMAEWVKETESLRADLLELSQGQISFTFDIWTTKKYVPFMAVTAHWIKRCIDNKLSLEADLLAFHHLPGSHTGENIANALFEVLDFYEITDNTGRHTADNASNNDTASVHLQRRFLEHGIVPDEQGSRIGCFPHIIHLAVTKLLSVATTVSEPTAESTVTVSAPMPPQRDVIAVARDLIRAVRSSALRREKFQEVVVLVFGHALELLRDLAIRWSSTLFMLERLVKLRECITIFLAQPDQRDLWKHQLTDAEWVRLGDIMCALKLPHQVQQVMSSETTPTLSMAIPAMESLVVKWEELAVQKPQLRTMISAGQGKINQYLGRMQGSKVYAIAMLVNPACKLLWINRRWSHEKRLRAISWIEEEVVKYASLPARNNGPPPQKEARTAAWVAMTDGLFTDQDHGVQHPAPLAALDELQLYLQAGLEPLGVDIVEWWDVHSRRYPVLFRIAMDYLPIQASAVPCERVFSSSGVTDGNRRTRMSPQLMGALQVVKFARKKARLDFSVQYLTDAAQLESIVQDMDKAKGTWTSEGSDVDVRNLITLFPEP